MQPNFTPVTPQGVIMEKLKEGDLVELIKWGDKGRVVKVDPTLKHSILVRWDSGYIVGYNNEGKVWSTDAEPKIRLVTN